jgi:hypothetical protein
MRLLRLGQPEGPRLDYLEQRVIGAIQDSNGPDRALERRVYSSDSNQKPG